MHEKDIERDKVRIIEYLRKCGGEANYHDLIGVTRNPLSDVLKELEKEKKISVKNWESVPYIKLRDKKGVELWLLEKQVKKFMEFIADGYEEKLFWELRVISKEKIVDRIFFRDIYSVVGHLKMNPEYEKYNCYIGILPRKDRDGTKSSIYGGNVIYTEFDSIESLKELPKIIKLLREEFLEPSFIFCSGHGVWLLWKLQKVVSREEIEELEERLLEFIQEKLGRYNPDKNVKDCTRIVRIPGTINNKNKQKLSYIIYFSDRKYDPEEIRSLLPDIKEENRQKGRILKDAEVLRITEILRPFYRKGFRDFIVFYLSGWLYKSGISYESARRVVEMLSEGDEEKRQRIYVLERTYGLRGTQPKMFKGKSGLQEIIEEVEGEERALEVIRELESILGTASPYRDSIFSLIDMERQIYYVANMRKGIIARAVRTRSGIRYREIIAETCPVSVEIYENPLGGLREYKIEFKGIYNKTLGPAYIDDIAERLVREGVVKHKRLIHDALSSIVIAFQKKNRAIVKREMSSQGFFIVDDEIRSVGWEEKDYSLEELREALEILNELAEKWYRDVIENFASAIKWGILAPFNYILKLWGTWMPWLLLYGTRDTGKTTIGKIILEIWGAGYETAGAAADTVARFGRIITRTTFPTLINEAGVVFSKSELIEMMKNAAEKTVARAKYVKGVYTEFPSLCPVIFTLNRDLPKDDALLKRFLVLTFTYVFSKTVREKMDEFERKVKPRLKKLNVIGFAVFKIFKEKFREYKGMSWEDIAEDILKEMYSMAGLKVPTWIFNRIQKEDITAEIVESIRATLLEDINNRYSRYIAKEIVEYESGGTRTLVRDEIELEERVRVLLERNYIPWAFIKDFKDGTYIVLTSSLINFLERNGIFIDGGLKSLAEILGWEYKAIKGRDNKTIKAIRVSFDNFIDFLLK